jgi:hypothetical protein
MSQNLIFTLTEEHRLKVSENREMRIFAHKKRDNSRRLKKSA